MFKRHHSTEEELLPHDVIELILERLDVKPLGRFKSVSKMWKSTIESRRFKERQLFRLMQSRGPDVFFVSRDPIEAEAQTVFGSSILSIVKYPNSNEEVSHGSCDGLICLFGTNIPNRTTADIIRWDLAKTRSGAHTLVWLSNSSELGLDNVTTCEVFDFSTNAWRYVLPASPCRILDKLKPVYLDGSLYWLTEGDETNVLSFDLHTETFHVICKAPFPHAPGPDPDLVSITQPYVTLRILDNCLCVSQKDVPTQTQEIWSLGGNKTWKKMCTIDLTRTFRAVGDTISGDTIFHLWPLPLPIAIIEENKLLLGRDFHQPLVVHDLHTKSYDLVLPLETGGYPVCYYQSLFTASSS